MLSGAVCEDGAETNARKMGRRTMVWESDPTNLLSGKESTKLEMCCKGIRALDKDLPKEGPCMLHSRLQTMYLRTNRIASLAPLSLPLLSLRILDVCFNELTGSQLKHLSSAPNLYQLYLSGNTLGTLEALPTMHELEVLVASSCHLTSLHMPVRASPTLAVLRLACYSATTSPRETVGRGLVVHSCCPSCCSLPPTTTAWRASRACPA